ncbi:unnamed protein product [Chironomus riparius]|uniref:Regulator of microtubule dynamics protein 1 n=1 Tax=Chironomus riparius TaxID=315576 RepID=A0A9N9S2Q2_9DIPT|nr:unnamed protein product [Chironomus riparius]
MADKVQLSEADMLHSNAKYEELVEFLKKLDQSDVEVQWRLTRALYDYSKLSANSGNKPDLVREAFDLIKNSLEKYDSHYAVHQWYAIMLDAKAHLDGLRARIYVLEEIKQHMEKAVELNPQDSISHYILGEFAFQVADLSWIEKKILSSVLTHPPACTYEEALGHFLKAEELKAGFYNLNYLMIGKCYIAMKDNEKAKEYLIKASQVDLVSEDDKKCKEEGTKLLAKLK